MPITSIKWDAKNIAINSQVRDFVIAIKNHKLKRLKTNKRPKKKPRFKRKKKPKHDDIASSTKLVKTSQVT
jgi:hypothetical protein